MSNFADNFSGERVGGVAGDRGELFGEGFSNVGVGGVNFVVEGNMNNQIQKIFLFKTYYLKWALFIKV